MAPQQESKPEGRKWELAYADQVLAESLLAARRRRGTSSSLTNG